MTQFAAEPVPMGLEPQLAEYLNRQFQALQLALMGEFKAPFVTAIPERPLIGAIIYLRGQDDPAHNGFYCCIEGEKRNPEDDQGEGEWKRIETTDLPTDLPRLSEPLY